MNNEIQEALLQSASILIDEKIKNIDYNYYFNAVVIETESLNSNNALVYTIACNPVYCSLNENIYAGSQLYEDEIRLIRNSTDIIGYYSTVYTGIRARAGLFCRVGDNVGVLVKNGDFSQKMIDDCPSYNANAIVKTVSQVGGSLFPSIPISLSVSVHTDDNGVDYGQAYFSWTVDYTDTYKTLGGFSLVIAQGESAPCIFKDATIDISGDSRNVTIYDTYKVVEQGKVYTAFLVAKDIYGNYMEASSNNAFVRFSMPVAPIVNPDRPSWYINHRSDYESNPTDGEYEDFIITGNFSKQGVLVTDSTLTSMVNYVGQSEEPYATYDVYGIEFTVPQNLGVIWKDRSAIDAVYIRKGNIALPYYEDFNQYLNEDGEYSEDTQEACADNYYCRIGCGNNAIDKFYNFGQSENTSDNRFIYMSCYTSCSIAENRISNQGKWLPSDINNESFMDEEMNKFIKNYILVLGMGIDGVPDPHKCTALLYDTNYTDGSEVSIDKDYINKYYTKDFIMTLYKQKEE